MPARGEIRTENQKRYEEGFWFWYNNGQYRTQNECAEQFGITQPTFNVWMVKGNYKVRARALELEKQKTKEITENINDVQALKIDLELINYLKSQFFEDVKRGKISIDSVKDLNMLLNLEVNIFKELNTKKKEYLKSIEEATSKSQQDSNLQISSDTAETLNNLYSELNNVGVDDND